jgi:hypothetical protein
VSISKQWGEIPGLQVASLYAHHFYLFFSNLILDERVLWSRCF